MAKNPDVAKEPKDSQLDPAIQLAIIECMRKEAREADLAPATQLAVIAYLRKWLIGTAAVVGAAFAALGLTGALSVISAAKLAAVERVKSIPTGDLAAAISVNLAKNNDFTKNVRYAILKPLNLAISDGCGVPKKPLQSTTLTDVSQLRVKIATTGRPVFVGLIPDKGADGNSSWSGTNFGIGAVSPNFADRLTFALSIVRDKSHYVLQSFQELSRFGDHIQESLSVYPGCFTIDEVEAGDHEYNVQLSAGIAKSYETVDTTLRNVRLIAFEL